MNKWNKNPLLPINEYVIVELLKKNAFENKWNAHVSINKMFHGKCQNVRYDYSLVKN